MKDKITAHPPVVPDTPASGTPVSPPDLNQYKFKLNDYSNRSTITATFKPSPAPAIAASASTPPVTGTTTYTITPSPQFATSENKTFFSNLAEVILLATIAAAKSTPNKTFNIKIDETKPGLQDAFEQKIKEFSALENNHNNKNSGNLKFVLRNKEGQELQPPASTAARLAPR